MLDSTHNLWWNVWPLQIYCDPEHGDVSEIKIFDTNNFAQSKTILWSPKMISWPFLTFCRPHRFAKSSFVTSPPLFYEPLWTWKFGATKMLPLQKIFESLVQIFKLSKKILLTKICWYQYWATSKSCTTPRPLAKMCTLQQLGMPQNLCPPKNVPPKTWVPIWATAIRSSRNICCSIFANASIFGMPVLVYRCHGRSAPLSRPLTHNWTFWGR